MTSLPHVAILTSAHPAFDTRVFTKEARTLAAAGYRVSFVVPHDRAETVDGVQLVPIPRERSRWRRWILGPWRVWRAAARLRAEIYHFHDPELIPVGLLLRATGAAVIYDVHEDVPKDVRGKAYLPRWSRSLLAGLLGFLQRGAARAFPLVVVAREDIAASFGAHPNVIVVSNYPSRALAGPSPVERASPAGRVLQVAYVGSMTPIRGIREMVTSLSRLPAGVRAHLHLYGRFSSPRFEEEIRALPGSAQVTIHGHIDYARVPEVLAAADVGIVCFLPEPNNVNSGPTKLFEYMACALPVIASDFPEWRRVVLDGGCGICVDPTDPSSIAGAIASLAQDPDRLPTMGRKGWTAIQGQLNWEAEAERLLAAYARLR